MNRSITQGNIIDVPADALVYSTNVQLMLTGGVGAALLARFGIHVQIDLQSRSLGGGRQLADVGEVLETQISGSPWKHVFHTIATNEAYHTEPDVVRSVLRSCLRRSVQAGDVASIVCSALGTGYGDLDLARFIQIAEEVCREFDNSPLQDFAIVCRDAAECEALRRGAVGFGGWALKPAGPASPPTSGGKAGH